MQRMIEATLINNLLSKYQTRYDECQVQWDKDNESLVSIKQEEENCMATGITPCTEQRKEFIKKDLDLLNVQIGTYECFIKDLKKLLGELKDEVR